ncbi:MAG: septal ring lytic transglycosylase RlpA family lipoprotein [Spirochaetae bacterium HGW-Spirochaetae-2]|jgi:rare lipoprotein A|nr:MAG: septal ring lytic transglycosylase RlpA family lipoprotein [Spirochaetae bacterium HGW-Spirochaetae-2]
MKQIVAMVLLAVFLLVPGISLFAEAPREQGIASWYDSDPNGPLTANGEQFDPTALTAAHKNLKFGTIVRVHDVNNGLSVDVRINDRGPFVDGRIIDLTPAAARALDMYEKGIIPVELEILYEPAVPESKYNRPGDTGWYRVQLGTFSNTKTVLQLFEKFHSIGFRPSVEVAQESLIRLSLRWIPEREKESSLKILESLGFKDVLLRSDTNPFL